MIGGWPLFTQTLLDLDPKKSRSSPSMDAGELAYVEKASRRCSRSRHPANIESVKRNFDKVQLKQEVANHRWSS